MRILVIEDEAALRSQLSNRLEIESFAVDACATGEEGVYMGKEYPYDLAIVDVGLPGMSGLEVIEQWRTQELSFPVLILTARGRWQDKVEGLESGADDYLVKPFHIEELLARVRALVRRASGKSSSVVTCGPLELNSSSQEVKVNNKRIDLTAFEYKVLEYLMLNQGKVISKTELTEHIYAQDFDRDSNVIEVFVGRLRKKIDPTDEFKPIETLRGRGYRFVLCDEQ
ncbi:MAG: response regulator transcription factor [Gammaproteobacteria bacterium]|nr:response regulator transcription factor [Gammaproteobacteria bacterium]